MNFDQLKNIIVDICSNVDPDDITDDATLADLNIDSLDLAQVIFAVENELDIEIDPDILEEITTVGDALEAINDALR